ncbi:Fic family protein [Rhizobium tarimense]|nr:Fic family protein [Pseudorhizobium tarimense]
MPSLVTGMIAFDRKPAQNMDAVIAAAILAFGFVYIHPFEETAACTAISSIMSSPNAAINQPA